MSDDEILDGGAMTEDPAGRRLRELEVQRRMAELADVEFERAVDDLTLDPNATLGDPAHLADIFSALRCHAAALAGRADSDDLWHHIDRLEPITKQDEHWATHAAQAVRSLLMGHPPAG